MLTYWFLQNNGDETEISQFGHSQIQRPSQPYTNKEEEVSEV